MWNERYAESGYAYGTEPNDFLRASAARLPDYARVLCLGEGEGRNAVFLAGLGHEVTALDQSSVGLAKARDLAAERGVPLSTVVADLNDHDLGTSEWDAIVAIWCHLPEALRRDVHRRVVAALRPGGVFLVEGYTPRQLVYGTGGPQTASVLYEPAALRTELDGLVVERCDELVREVHEGTYHQGTSAVVQLIASRPG